MGRTVYCANCGKQLDSDYASTFVGEPGYYCGSSCLREFQKKHAANAESYKSYTDMFGNKVRIVGSTGEFEVKTGFWGWTTASFKGKVEYRYPNGDLYVGEVHGQSFNGKGKMFWKSTGNTYEGDWVYDYRTGKGRFTWADGTYHEGDFVRGKYEGYGIHTYTDGGKYEGQFHDDKRNGKGKMTWPNGDTYVGDWVENFRTGKGRYVWANGAYYEGDFARGKFHGNGKRWYIDNHTYIGEFKNGVRHGKGILMAPDGTAVEYYYENDKKICKVSEATDEIVARIYGSAPKEVIDTPAVEKKTTIATEVKKVSVAPTVSKTDGATYAEKKATASDLEIWDQLVKAKSAQKRKEEILASHSVIVIPEGTKRIPGYLFDKCLNLKGVCLNHDISEIGMWDFRGCKNLGPVVVIPKGVKKIYSYAFENCTSLKKIVLPNNITIDRLAFVDSGISDVEFETDPPRGVTVGYGAFKHCDKNMTKEMKDKIKGLNSNAFK